MTNDDPVVPFGSLNIREQARELRESIVKLSTEITNLNDRLDAVNNHIYKTVQKLRLIVAGLVVGAIVSLGVLVVVVWNNYRINAVQERTSNEVLCPLYVLFLKSYHPEAQPPEKLPEYEASFEVIRESYTALDCKATQ